MSESRRPWQGPLILALVVVVLDAASKALAWRVIGHHADVGLPGPGRLTIRLDAWAQGFWSIDGAAALVVPTLTVVGVVVALVSGRVRARTTRIACGLALGGALGSLVERFWRGVQIGRVMGGPVTELIDPFIWPSLSLADVASLTAAALLVVRGLALLLRPRAEAPTPPQPEAL